MVVVNWSVLQKSCFKKFAKLTGKHRCPSLFLRKLQTECLTVTTDHFKRVILLKKSWRIIFLNSRSSHWRCSVKIVLLKISQNSQKNTCARISFLIRLQTLGLQLYLKRDSATGVFLWILCNFQERFFHRTPLDDCFWNWYYWLISRAARMKVKNIYRRYTYHCKASIFH